MISAVTEQAFTARRQHDWTDLDQLLHRVTQRGLKSLQPEELSRISPLYRDACSDLARAQATRYSAPLVDYLVGLVAAGHAVVYGPHARGGRALRAVRFRMAFEAFPRTVRKHWPRILLAGLLFFIPLALGVFASLRDPNFAFRIVPEAQLRPLTEAYAKGFDAGRDAGQGALMAGFYVNNNVGIALRCFALGIFGGLGSAFYLVDNGLSIGAILGYVASQGAGANVITFIVSHGSLELGAIVLAGGAGLSLGWSVVAPGDMTRLASLQSAGRDVLVIVAGASIMLLMAAAIEAFWSGSSVPSEVKRAFGLTMFLIVASYLVFVGRGEGGEKTWT
jgi:uncharacterized membrane protein SpoIIM required for sporulation